ncbi:MAG: penicillin-binding transpeptidase domain-containing protein [Candidatus Andersenbacteria bacterium]
MNTSDEFIQPVPLNPEHAGRTVGRRGQHTPFEFEEVLKNPRGDDQPHIADKQELRNFRWLYVISGLLLVGLLGRSAFLQIAQGQRYRGLAEGNRLRALVLAAPRGVLYDRNQAQLAENIPSYQLVLVPVDLPTDDDTRAKLFKKVAKNFNVDLADLSKTYGAQDPHSFDPVPVGDELSRDAALLIQAHPADYPGVHADVRAVRRYADAEALSHVYGYVGKLTAEEYADHQDYELNDQIGKTGVEQSYESTLRGTNGAQNVEVDAFGRVVDVLATQPPTAGNDLVLTVDAGLQHQLYTSLVAAAKRSGKQRAAAVAVDPRNGEILAYASVPGFDANAFAVGTDRKKIGATLTDANQPLFDRPIAGTYPPGSTFKPFVATGALQSGNITEDTTYNDVGYIKVGGQTFRSWKPGGQGVVNVIGAIANSVNTFFFSVGGGYGDIKGLGIRALDTVAAAFGFGAKTGVDSARRGGWPAANPEYKQETFHEDWFLGDTYNSSIARGSCSPATLQPANATAAVANGGNGLVAAHRQDYGAPRRHDAGRGDQGAQLRRWLRRSFSRSCARHARRSDGRHGASRGPAAPRRQDRTALPGSGELNAWFTACNCSIRRRRPQLAEQAGEGSTSRHPSQTTCYGTGSAKASRDSMKLQGQLLADTWLAETREVASAPPRQPKLTIATSAVWRR